MAELTSVEEFNRLALALARERRGEFACYVAREAVRRGYRYHGDRQTGSYVDLAPEEYRRTMEELERRERKLASRRLAKGLRQTRVPGVKAAWEQWVYRGGKEDTGALLIADFRRSSRDHIFEFDQVPESLYRKLFAPDAARTLTQIMTIYGGKVQNEPIRDWREAY